MKSVTNLGGADQNCTFLSFNCNTFIMHVYISEMKVALVSVIYNHGKILAHSGTSLLLAFEGMKGIDKLDVYTQVEREGNSLFTSRAMIVPVIDPERPLTYLKLFRLVTKAKYDRIVVNSMPTSQGNKNISNLLYLCLPIIWSKIYDLKVSVLYHNSPFLNEVGKLGYSGLMNRFKSSIIKAIEKRMYSSCNVYFLLKLYAEKIKKIIPNARVNWINAAVIDGFTTLYLNKKLNFEVINMVPSGKEATILIYGSWGPQKDVSKALEAVKIVKDSGLMAKVIVSGDSNLHFPGYISFFEETLANYKEVIDERIGYVSEVDLYSIFERSHLIILPYVVPGGFSGVLSISMLFGLHVIVPEFDEYKEEAAGYGRVHFISKNFSASEIAVKIEDILGKIKQEEERAIAPAAMFKQFVDEIENSGILE